MAIQVLHNYETGNGLEISQEHKIQIKPDNSGNVQFEVSTNGLKGNVSLPEPFNPSTLETKIQSLEQAKEQTNAEITQIKQELATKPSVDIKLSGLTFENTKLKGTLSDGSFVETEFTSEIVVTAIENASDEQKERIVAALKPKLLEALKGEEIQDFAGNQKGFLLAKTVA